MNSNKSTPMMRQYLSIKEAHKDAILLYRMGDFFEMFFEDAQKASPILEIALTSRNKNDASPIPMCGVPAKAIKGYISKLLDKGIKVAICDQVEDPAQAKGIVKREVTQVITPGMIIDEDFLDEKKNNYILALSINSHRLGLSYLDISTGRFRVTESGDHSIIVDEILRISPNEILIENVNNAHPIIKMIQSILIENTITLLDEQAFEKKSAEKRLIHQFNTFSLEGFGCHQFTLGIQSAGALLYYVADTQKQDISHLKGIESYSLNQYLLIDTNSRQNLELTQNLRTGTRKGTLLGVIDQTMTALGSRMLNDWLLYPLIDSAKIDERLSAVEEVKAQIDSRNSIRQHLKKVADMERFTAKLSMGHAGPRDLISFKNTLLQLPEILKELYKFESPLYRFHENTDTLWAMAKDLSKAIREDAPLGTQEGGIINTGYNTQLDELIHISRDSRQYLAEMETREREKTGIGSLKVKYNRVFGYYIEISKTHIKSVPTHYFRKQTLVNAERYITEELKEFELKILNAQEKRNALEHEIFKEIRDHLLQHIDLIIHTAQFIARLDCLSNLAHIADENGYIKPQLNTQGYININEGRHPVIEKMISGERFVPNHIEMDNIDKQILLITGPNMAGKSTVLRQVALLVLMAQIGSYIPAESAEINITDRIFTRVGALDNLSQGQSTFMVEMQETANILNNATEQSLVIMDEIGRGTSTFDGMSIAWATAEFLHDLKGKGVKTLFATHYHELTDLAFIKPRVKNFNIAVKEFNEEIIFLRKLLPGSTNKSYGIQVARLAGIPFQVVLRAKKILEIIERGGSICEELNAGQKRLKAKKNSSTDRQLNLFSNSGKSFISDSELEVLTELKKIEITVLSPIEALNKLNQLTEKLKGKTRKIDNN